MNAEFYKLGCEMALRVCGLDKAADEMDPGVQAGIQQRRTSAMAEGNRYAQGWSPNVPMNRTQQAMAPRAQQVAAAKPAVDYSAAAGKPFMGVGGTKAPIDYSAMAGQQSYR